MIRESELIINDDGSIFHLHLTPEQVSDTVILVGDPGRVRMIGNYLTDREPIVENREFVSLNGTYGGRQITVLSTGIGTDNIDIVINELDALVNIDLKKREIREKKRSLRLVRIGTSGGLQPDIPVNSWIASHKSIGFDGMLPFYDGRVNICDIRFEASFRQFMRWPEDFPSPYVVDASPRLLDLFSDHRFLKGVNISAPGFYGPQGRVLRLPLAYPDINEKLGDFRYEDYRITNYEMESSAIYGLSGMLGHEALTICLLIANRMSKTANQAYHSEMEKLVHAVLDTLTK